MADLIQLLPDSIANQIAAGEVIQRPASVVKELMENAIDAGATSVKLIVKEAGKALIQVIDNGCGMSETDARMSFERHATSKIRAAKDLFSIRTMGFRGEALASIAAVAQVEMRTRLHPEELGTRIVNEGSEVKTQEACQCVGGTSISVKNLFYNVPARRNFLKSNTVEMRHIMDEFQRLAIAHRDVFFSLHHNNTEVFHLPPTTSLRQRVVGIFGTKTNIKLVPIEVETEIVRLYGFIGKPEYAKKTRGEQMFFVNQRFIKSGYLHHSVMLAYEEQKVLPKNTYPLYIIFMEIDPAMIDINVHPTKQEIKFDDERLIYHYLKVAVRHALAQHSITPSLDFEQEASFSDAKNYGMPKQRPESITIESKATAKNPPGESSGQKFDPPPSGRQKANLQNWKMLYEGLTDPEDDSDLAPEDEDTITIESKWTEEGELDDAAKTFSKEQKEPYQIHATYIVSQIKSGFFLIDQQAAHERILYEQYLKTLEKQDTVVQKELFPTNINLAPADAALIKEILPQINLLGFDIREFGKDAFVIHGVPANMTSGQDNQKIIESLLEQYKRNTELKLGIRENIAQSMARSTSIKRGQLLTVREMKELIDQLFACQVPFKSPSEKNCFLTFDLEELDKKFKP